MNVLFRLMHLCKRGNEVQGACQPNAAESCNTRDHFLCIYHCLILLHSRDVSCHYQTIILMNMLHFSKFSSVTINFHLSDTIVSEYRLCE